MMEDVEERMRLLGVKGRFGHDEEKATPSRSFSERCLTTCATHPLLPYVVGLLIGFAIVGLFVGLTVLIVVVTRPDQPQRIGNGGGTCNSTADCGGSCRGQCLASNSSNFVSLVCVCNDAYSGEHCSYERHRKSIAFLLCLLPWGLFGADRYYLGLTDVPSDFALFVLTDRSSICEWQQSGIAMTVIFIVSFISQLISSYAKVRNKNPWLPRPSLPAAIFFLAAAILRLVTLLTLVIWCIYNFITISNNTALDGNGHSLLPDMPF